MISILIPVYNYNVVPLVKQMLQQAIALEIDFEIIVRDDHSSNLCVESANRVVEELPNVLYIRSSVNKGRAATRNDLAKAASFNWLLFMDADVLPHSFKFLPDYVNHLQKADIIFGGITYQEELPERQILRWKYGRAREQQDLAKRIKNPYISIISQGFLIKKHVFLKVNPAKRKGYGLDVLFTYNLKKNGVSVLHIDNPVVHHGLETNKKFIKKSEKAIHSIIKLSGEGDIPLDHYRIQKVALKMKSYRMVGTFLMVTNIFQDRIEKNLLSPNPSLKIFDIYRLRLLLEKSKSNA